jgi:hypothetical protein
MRVGFFVFSPRELVRGPVNLARHVLAPHSLFVPQKQIFCQLVLHIKEENLEGQRSFFVVEK